MVDNTITKTVTTLSDGTKVLTVFRTVTTPNGTKQIQVSQPQTLDSINATIAALQADAALFTA